MLSAILGEMYRDGATHHDEHDRAVGAIQIAEGLITSCLLAAEKLQGPERPQRWRAAHALHDDYPEIWRQLDSARGILASRGTNTIGYDEMRGQVLPVLPIREDARPLDTSPLDDARRALDELRLAIPGTDWKAIDARTTGLVGIRLVSRRGRLAVASILAGLVAAVATWTYSTIPEPKRDPRAEMRRELAVVVDDRKARIDDLELLIGGRCDRLNVHEYVKLLAMDGRWQDARTFGADYQARCGEDPIVQKWANAPRPSSTRRDAMSSALTRR